MDTPDGSIVITPKEFYDGVRQDIADIKQGLAPLSGMHDDLEDLKARVSALEARVWRASGFAAAIGLVASWVVPNLTK